MIQMRLIQHGSPDYEQMIELRARVLLQPIGVPFSYIKRDAEAEDFLIAAFENNVMAGCCVLSPRNDGAVQLRQMAVENRLQGTGLGRKIVAFAEDIAKERGFATLYMHARNPVIPFYEKCGYKIVGDEFFEVGIGHHKMQKSLQPI